RLHAVSVDTGALHPRAYRSQDIRHWIVPDVEDVRNRNIEFAGQVLEDRRVRLDRLRPLRRYHRVEGQAVTREAFRQEIVVGVREQRQPVMWPLRLDYRLGVRE